MATIGRNKAIVEVGNWKFSGYYRVAGVAVRSHFVADRFSQKSCCMYERMVLGVFYALPQRNIDYRRR